MRTVGKALTILVLSGLACQSAEEIFGCEPNPTGDPVGGGKGYRRILTSGDFTVTTADDFVAALAKATAGQVIFLPSGVEIDVTGRRDLRIPGGVTLAGTRGLGDDPGARLLDSALVSHTLFLTDGPGIRITGLRIEGGYAGTERTPFALNGISVRHSDVEIDNCDIGCFNVVGIGVSAYAIRVHIHHNHIHDCTQNGLGYGVSTSSSDVRIIANIFDNCRHHIASSGSPGSGYEAAWNLVLERAIGHHLDMHGGRDRGDGTDIAGDWMHIHHNTFRGTQRHVVIRGVPSQGARIHNNWFAAPPERAVITGGNTQVGRNAYGPERRIAGEDLP